ncbi:MAG: DNA gyrase subunit A [Gemmatimonadota bacterium]|nr:MAG: DNA gyrase subunit A [Gemmatimonadota bacterium]
MTAQSRERIVPRLIEEEMRESFLDYSMSVIVQRALPDVRDGLKPVHRRILFAMHELGLTPDRPHKKSAAVVGDVLGKYHPHGDSAVYDAMVRMVQDFSLRYPLIDGQGNFGSIDGDSAAAYRYTEARLAAVAQELLADIDRETVDFTPNFDERLQEPTVLPARLPNLLVNGSSGIAVGMSTNVPPHNLREVAAALHALVEEPEPTVDSLMKHIPGPDFPTGGFVVGTEGIRSMYETGRGRMRVRARIVQESLRGGKKQLVVSELPYAVSKTRIIEQIANLARKGKLDEITDMRDESDRDGLRLVVELKRGVKAAKVLARLFKKTSLETTFGGIVLALDQGEPREFDLLTLLERYRDHRLEVIQKRSRYELEKAQSERHVTEGLLAALDAIDEVVVIIRNSADRTGASQTLQERLGLSEVQADAILNMRLARLTSLEHGGLKDRLKALNASIKHLKAILKSEAAQLEVMLEELDEIVEKYGDDRRTVILDGKDRGEIEVEAQIAAEDVVVTVSHEGFVKRVPMHLYQRRISSGKALAGMDKYDDDYLEKVFVAKTQGWILTFTERGHVYFLPVLDVPEGSRASRGQSVYSLTAADRGDPVVAMLPVDDLSGERFLVFLSERGVMKRSKLADFANPRVGGIIASGLKDGDRILDVAFSEGDSEVMLITREGRAIRFAETDLTVMGRTARGVKGIDLQKGDVVVGMLLIRREAWVLTVTDGGMGRRTDVGEFPLQKRGGRGTLATPQQVGGSLVSALEVLEGDAVMIVAASGRVSRVSATEIPARGRRMKGSPVVDLEKGDRVVEVTRAHGEPSRSPEAEAIEKDPDHGPAGSTGQLDLLGQEEVVDT